MNLKCSGSLPALLLIVLRRSVVELLEDIAHDERCGEAQQMLGNAAACEVIGTCHKITCTKEFANSISPCYALRKPVIYHTIFDI